MHVIVGILAVILFVGVPLGVAKFIAWGMGNDTGPEIDE